MKASKPIVAAGLMALAVMLAGCSLDTPEQEPDGQMSLTEEEAVLLDAAEGEGKLVWYSVLPPDSVEKTVAAFEDRYQGITIEALRLSSGPMATRYSQERASGLNPADVLTISSPAFFVDAQSQGWVHTELDLPALEAWPSEYYDRGLVTTGLLPLLIGYNTDQIQVADALDTWEAVLDEKWKGGINLGDPRTVPAYLALAELWYQEYGPEFLTELAALEPNIVSSIVPGSQELAAGGAQLMVPDSYTVLAPLIAENAPVAANVPAPTTGVEYQTALAINSPSPNAAKLFVNFLLTEQGQIVTNAGGGTSVLGDISDDLTPLPEGYRALGPLLRDAYAHEDELLALLGIAG